MWGREGEKCFFALMHAKQFREKIQQKENNVLSIAKIEFKRGF